MLVCVCGGGGGVAVVTNDKSSIRVGIFADSNSLMYIYVYRLNFFIPGPD